MANFQINLVSDPGDPGNQPGDPGTTTAPAPAAPTAAPPASPSNPPEGTGSCTSDSDCSGTTCPGGGTATCQAAGMGQDSGTCGC